jgi:transposase-like protein
MDTSTIEVVDDQTKRDTRSRRITSAQRRAELLALYQSSGLTQKAFAKREGVNTHTFAAWLSKHRHGSGALAQAASARHAPAAFVELSAPAPLAAPAAPLEVVLRDGRVARGAHACSLATLVRLLEG